jgi:hypothetical protein
VYVDNVRRKWEWEARHPEATIKTDRDHEGRFIFTAEIPDRDPVRRNDLGELLDALEQDS